MITQGVLQSTAEALSPFPVTQKRIMRILRELAQSDAHVKRILEEIRRRDVLICSYGEIRIAAAVTRKASSCSDVPEMPGRSVCLACNGASGMLEWRLQWTDFDGERVVRRRRTVADEVAGYGELELLPIDVQRSAQVYSVWVDCACVKVAAVR